MSSHQQSTAKSLTVLFVRYCVALIVASIIWAVVGVVGFIIFVLLASYLLDSLPFGTVVEAVVFFAWVFLTGFSGVYFSCLCLYPRNRRFGSVLISVFGYLLLYIVVLCLPYRQDGPFTGNSIPALFPPTLPFLFCGVGPLAAIIYFWRRRPPNTARGRVKSVAE